MSGTNRRVMIQLKTTMPSSENVAHVCSQSHLRTSVMGRMKVPCNKPANRTRRKPRSNGIVVIVVGPNCLRTKLPMSFHLFDRSREPHRESAKTRPHPLLYPRD